MLRVVCLTQGSVTLPPQRSLVFWNEMNSGIIHQLSDCMGGAGAPPIQSLSWCIRGPLDIWNLGAVVQLVALQLWSLKTWRLQYVPNV